MPAHHPHFISKTIYLSFLNCSKNEWLRLQKPELLEHFAPSEFDKHLMEQGNEVESYARNLFPGGIEVAATGEEAREETVRLMTADVPAIFQATFIADGFIARNDVLAWDDDAGRWDLYEVKGTNTLKEGGPGSDHIDDLAFQASLLKRAGIAIGRYFLVHLNKEYVRRGELDIQALFLVEDQTEKVLAKLPETETLMAAAKDYLNREEEPAGECGCIYQGRSRHCTTFQYSNTDVPEYSVHDLARIGLSKKRLKGLVDRRIFDLADIPEDEELSDIQRNQVQVHQQGRPILNIPEIRAALAGLTFPLYFLDYETFPPAIPIFDGFSPYQQVPFQVSVHILDAPDASLRHVEFLHKERSDPSSNLVVCLKQHVGSRGSVIVWNRSFEEKVNRDLAKRLPADAAFLVDLNARIYDLREPFQKQHYVHHGFRGSTSIKKVLPTLVPELKYGDLAIQEGGQASDAWWRMVSPMTTNEEREKIATDLKIYCGSDTYAMFAVWKHLAEIA